MRAEEIATLPPQPESVAEWEDLLVRLEIVPRVVRNTIDEVVNAAAASRVLSEAARREREIGAWLETASRMEGVRSGDDLAADSAGDPAELAYRFASLRARTFAMVQRRGLDVWQWQASLRDGPAVTAHQLLFWLTRRDARLLADLRNAAAGGQGGC